MIEYAVGNSGETIPATGWETDITDVDITNNDWIWTRIIISDVDGTSKTLYLKGITGANIISRMQSDYVEDLNDLGFTDPGFAKWNAFTLNSPRTDGATTATNGYVIHYMSDANTGVQFAWVSGDSEIYTRSATSGVWGEWSNYGDKFMAFTSSLTPADQNTILTNLGLNATNAKEWAGITLTFIKNVTISDE